MPLENGWFVFGDDLQYEAEATYQLKYYVSSAKICINYIIIPDNTIIKTFESNIRYYRFYLDHLFNYVGLINDRFITKNDTKKDKAEKILLNRKNYNFVESEFPIISIKDSRNIIEHLDDRNLTTMSKLGGVGGFNVIFPDSDNELVKSLITNRERYPYTLDLVNNKVLFFNIRADESGEKKFEIDLNQLLEELCRLENNILIIDSFIHDTW